MSRVVIGLLLFYVASLPAAEWRYEARFDVQTETLQVDVCAPAGEPLNLVALDAAAFDYLLDQPEWSLDRQRSRMQWQGKGCGRYSVALGQAADAGMSERGYRIGPDLMVWPTSWLWWPPERDARLRLLVQLPPGWSFSSPWPQPDPARLEFTLGTWPRYWSALTVFGKSPIERIAQTGGELQLSILGDLSTAQRQKLHDWVVQISKLPQLVIGRLPSRRAQILVVPMRARGGGPVPWAQVYRGGFGAAHFFVDPAASVQEFREDWTGAHEISHLLHPYLGPGGSWMGEGLASYMQNVLRARAGILSPEDAWERLIAGFERGRKDAARDRSLAQVSEGMHRSHAFMRVYWSGAAYWLAADVELRRRSARKLSLDDALSRFARCCLPANEAWSPARFARALDREIGLAHFEAAAVTAAAATNFPDLDALYRDLGIQLNERRQVIGFSDDAPLAGIRRQILEKR